MTLLELLAAAAPAGVVPADVVALRVHDRTRRAGVDVVPLPPAIDIVAVLPVLAPPAASIASAPASDSCSYCSRRRSGPALAPAARAGAPPPPPGRAARGTASARPPRGSRPELCEHDVPLVLVLDERILLCHGAQVDAFTHVVHPVEMLAPALIDDLEDHEALELAHQVRRQLLFLRGIRVARIFLEVLDERLA